MLPVEDQGRPTGAGVGIGGLCSVDATSESVSLGRREALLGAAGGVGLATLGLATDAASASPGRRHGHLSDWEKIFNRWSRYSFSIDSATS
jgi:hypothetical protein